jgi:hypothetical protein
MSNRKSQILAWLRTQNASRVDPALATRAASAFPGASDRLLRSAFRDSGLPLDPLVEGVRQDTLDNLARTLLALAAQYEAGDPALRHQVRALVITARQHAAFAALRKPKDEDLLWMRTWLENPPLFAAWLEIRRQSSFNR